MRIGNISSLLARIAGILFLLTISPAIVCAAVPRQLNYQGYLTDSSGKKVADGSYLMEFAIYDSPIGGAVLWSESQTVTVTNGIYNVILGQPEIELEPADFNGNLYLGVSINGDPEMTPRQKLTSVAFSMKAAIADSSINADTLDGKDSSAFAGTNHGHAFSEITGTATDTQIPNDITIDHAYTADSAASAAHATTADTATSATSAAHATTADSATTATIADHATTAGIAAGAGDADMVDGHHADAFALSSHHHDFVYYSKTYVDALENRIANLEETVNKLTALLAGVTRSGNDIKFTGVNVHVLNGTGVTYAMNGLGNFIVGYNEFRDNGGDDRSGSHNIVTGSKQNFSSCGGLIAGYNNTISDYYATVTGGTDNSSRGLCSHVSGGRNNKASGSYSSVVGGGSINPLYGNEAFGKYSAVLGGIYNIAGDPNRIDHEIGQQSTVSGGDSNRGSGTYSNVSGGKNNNASGYASSVNGGQNNKASGNYAVVVGGGSDNATHGNEAVAHYSAILGGIYNVTGDPLRLDHTKGQRSTVAGGDTNNASGIAATVSGGKLNIAGGNSSSIGGGNKNQAVTDYSSVGGGLMNIAENGWYATISGARPNYDSGWVTIDQDEHITLEHNLKGDTDNYVVDLQFKDSVYTSYTYEVHQCYYGLNYYRYDSGDDGKELGVYWYKLTDTSIMIARGKDDLFAEECRLRIWVNK